MQRKHIFVIGILMLFAALRAEANSYTVKAGGGGDYSTIQSCASAMSPGDTCTVYAGTYNEVVTISAGTSGNYKTLTVNSGDTVYVYGFVINSHTKVNGFYITRPSSPSSNSCVAVTGNSTDWAITNNVMYACGSGAMIEEPVGANVQSTSYGYIAGNTLSYACSTSSAPNVCEGMYISGDYHLIENNDISHVSDAITNFGVRNVYRSNTFHDASPNDCGSHSSNCHIDFIESEPVINVSRPTQYNMYEANIIRNNLGGNGHAFLTQADGCGGQCFGVIIRYNNMAHVGTYGIIDDNSGSTRSPGFSHIKAYNNSWVDFNNSGQTVIVGHQNGSTAGADINNIYYWPKSINGTPYYVDSSSSSGYTAGSNIAYCTGSCSFQNRTQSGSFTSDATGNIVANPNFANYAANDFTLASGSPALGAGTYLTTATNSGTASTSMSVTDASFFFDGAGIVNGDWIRIGASTTAQIASINYSTNAITLANAVSWSNGAPIYLYKDSRGNVLITGTNPDIGASPFFPPSAAAAPPPPPPTSGAPNPPTGLKATVL